MDEPIVMRADAEGRSSCVFPVLWLLLALLTGAMAIEALQVGLPWNRWYIRLFRFLLLPAAVLGLLHGVSFLLRKRMTLLVGTDHICLVTKRRFLPEREQIIPVPEIVSITSYTNELVIKTQSGKYRLPQLRDANAFADKLRPYLRQQGADVKKTAKEHYIERIAITKCRKQKRAGLMPYTDIPAEIPATADENGVPILPQQLTAEQAEGVFMPAGSAETDKETKAI